MNRGGVAFRACAPIFAIWSVLLEGNVWGEALPPPETIAPSGSYRVAWLKLENGWEKGADVMLFLGIRSGKATTVWFCAPARSDCHRMWADQITVACTGDTLSGEVKGRMVKVWAPTAHVGQYVYTLDAKVSEGKLFGAFTVRISLFGSKEQTFSGALSGELMNEDRLKKDHAFPSGKDWPCYYGDGFSFRGPDCGAKLIDDLAAAKPLWKAEEQLPCMWGKGPDRRYKRRACVVGVTGGASSPVVAGGLAYVFYFKPSGSLPTGQNSPTEAQLRQEAANFTPSSIGQQAYVDWHRLLADDVVVCIDAVSGKTVWKTILKERGINHQTHKWRGFNPVPLVADGVVYVVNYANRVYALDAKTGKLLWENGQRASNRFTAAAVGPVMADGVLVATVGETVGLDPKTGQELWKAPGGNLLVWRRAGKERVIALCENRFKDAAGKNVANILVACIEPKTGQVLWKAETPLWSPREVGPIIEGDFLVGCEATKAEKPGEADFSKDTQVLCYRLREDGLEKLWAVPAPFPAVDKLALAIAGGCVYVSGSQETFCLKLDTGEQLGVAKAGGARTQTMFAADGRVLIQPEGRHGGQSFFMLDGVAFAGNRISKSFRLLPASASSGELKHPGAGQWVPPHVPDTAYANHPLGYPLVDGRLFIRGHDGLYCYDLRMPGP